MRHENTTKNKNKNKMLLRNIFEIKNRKTKYYRIIFRGRAKILDSMYLKIKWGIWQLI